MKKAYLWYLSVSSRPRVPDGSDIQQVHLVVLVDPVQVEPMFVNPQRHRRSYPRVLKRKTFF